MKKLIKIPETNNKIIYKLNVNCIDQNLMNNKYNEELILTGLSKNGK